MDSLNILIPKTITGGTYDYIRVFDRLTVTNDLKCDHLDLYHEAIFNGLLLSKKLNIEGLATFNELVKALEIRVKGSMYSYKDVQANIIHVINELKLYHGKILTNHIEISGIVNANEIDAASLILTGTLNSNILLRSNKIEIKDQANGYINEMIGSIITIEPVIPNALKINKISGYQVKLENVSVDTLSAKFIEIGDNCQINHVEYL